MWLAKSALTVRFRIPDSEFYIKVLSIWTYCTSKLVSYTYKINDIILPGGYRLCRSWWGDHRNWTERRNPPGPWSRPECNQHFLWLTHWDMNGFVSYRTFPHTITMLAKEEEYNIIPISHVIHQFGLHFWSGAKYPCHIRHNEKRKRISDSNITMDSMNLT